MKKTFLILAATVSFGISNLNANEGYSFSTCEDYAFKKADQVYEDTGDGFAAGSAFEAYLFFCEYGSILF